MRWLPGLDNPVRQAWLRSCGFNTDKVLALPLVHSRRVCLANCPADLAGMEGDGIITINPEACTVVTVADCMPIFLFDPDSGAFGVLHSGWKGTGILAEATRMMERIFGTRPGRLGVTFGPRIGSCCYTVDEQRAFAFANEFGSAAVLHADDGPRLDLVAANLALAENLGIASVSVVDACTACNAAFGSFRREGPDTFTRMAAAMGNVCVVDSL
jgi:hypothetical protein